MVGHAAGLESCYRMQVKIMHVDSRRSMRLGRKIGKHWRPDQCLVTVFCDLEINLIPTNESYCSHYLYICDKLFIIHSIINILCTAFVDILLSVMVFQPPCIDTRSNSIQNTPQKIFTLDSPQTMQYLGSLNSQPLFGSCPGSLGTVGTSRKASGSSG